MMQSNLGVWSLELCDDLVYLKGRKHANHYKSKSLFPNRLFLYKCVFQNFNCAYIFVFVVQNDGQFICPAPVEVVKVKALVNSFQVFAIHQEYHLIQWLAEHPYRLFGRCSSL